MVLEVVDVPDGGVSDCFHSTKDEDNLVATFVDGVDHTVMAIIAADKDAFFTPAHVVQKSAPVLGLESRRNSDWGLFEHR